MNKKHLGSDLCPQTVQRGAEGLPDGCAEKQKMFEKEGSDVKNEQKRKTRKGKDS